MTQPSTIEPLAGAEGLRVLVNSCPKAGTHLLLELVRQIIGDGDWMRDRDVKSPGDIGGFLAGVDERIVRHETGFAIKGHFPWTPSIETGLADRGFVVLLMVRDLRDVACSTLRWMRDLSPDWPASQSLLRLPADDARLERILTGLTNEHPFDRDAGIDWTEPLPERYAQLIAWGDHLHHDAVVRYEDLIGTNGEQTQLETIRGVLGVLGLHADQATMTRIASAVYNPDAVTFHTGSSGGWMQDWTAEHRRLFLELQGDRANARFGYGPTPSVSSQGNR